MTLAAEFCTEMRGFRGETGGQKVEDRKNPGGRQLEKALGVLQWQLTGRSNRN